MPGTYCLTADCNISPKKTGISILKISKAKSGIPEHLKWREEHMNIFFSFMFYIDILKIRYYSYFYRYSLFLKIAVITIAIIIIIIALLSQKSFQRQLNKVMLW